MSRQAVNHEPSHLRVKRLSGSSGLSGWFRLSRVFGSSCVSGVFGYMRLTRSTRQGTVADTVFLPLISTFPHLRKSMQMQYGQHVDTLFPRMEVHAIGKRNLAPKPDCWSSYHTAAAWMSRSDSGWTTSRRAIRQINDLAICARCLCGHRSRVGQRWGSHCTPPSARE